ncbi:MAG: hypothetical protein ACKO9D_08865 [Gammaproteobacteria bacterium]
MASPASVKTWDDETDVLVCGYGLAGACAAIEAHDLDPAADILVLAKMSERYQGGNSRASGQSLPISKDAEALKAYRRACRCRAARGSPSRPTWSADRASAVASVRGWSISCRIRILWRCWVRWSSRTVRALLRRALSPRVLWWVLVGGPSSGGPPHAGSGRRAAHRGRHRRTVLTARRPMDR